MQTVLLASALVGAGLGVLVVGILVRVRSRDENLAEILDLPFGESDVPVTAVTERSGALFEGTAGLVTLASKTISRFDHRGSLATLLERARLPLRSGEYAIITASGGIVTAALLLALTGQWIYAPVGIVAAVAVAAAVPKVRIVRRKKALEQQLPDALAIVAGSLSAGHTFLRAIHMLAEESEDPLSEELMRVVHETRLGAPVVDALERMAERSQLRDLHWVVQAIRIQQTVGGKLADLLHTLADYIRAREDLRREVRVLTAEGRISAWVLGALPVGVLMVLQVSNPEYMKAFYTGFGPLVLLGTGLSIAGGIVVILRMVKIEI